MTFKGPFQPKLFYDSILCFAGRLSKSEVGEIKIEAEEQILLYRICTMQETLPMSSAASPKNQPISQ